MIQALLGVEGLHEKQVVHQDLHLGNFLIVSLDDELRLVVADLDASLDWTKEEQTALSEYKLFEAARVRFLRYSGMCGRSLGQANPVQGHQNPIEIPGSAPYRPSMAPIGSASEIMTWK